MLKLHYSSIVKSTPFFHQLCVALHVRTVLALQMTLATVLLDTKGKGALTQVCCATACILVHMVPQVMICMSYSYTDSALVLHRFTSNMLYCQAVARYFKSHTVPARRDCIFYSNTVLGTC